MSLEWYALRSKPNGADALWREATVRGFKIFYPRGRVQPVNPRARKIKPYFPGYMFVQADIQAAGFSAFAWMPYSNGLVSFDSRPSPVPARLVDAIRRRLEEIDDAGADLLKSGDIVRIQAGPFIGYEAIFDSRLSGDLRVRVLLQLLSKRRLPLSAGRQAGLSAGV